MNPSTPVATIKTDEGAEPAPVPGMPFRMSWGAIFAGTLAGVGIWIVLYALGLALGFAGVPADGGTVRGSGLFSGVWGLVVPLVALFLGAAIAGRSVGPVTRGGGAVHGLVVWSLTAVAGVWIVARLFGSMMGGAVTIGMKIATAQTTGVTPTTGQTLWIMFGALFLGLLAALIGGAVGVTRAQRSAVVVPMRPSVSDVRVVSPPVKQASSGQAVRPVSDDSAASLRDEIAALRRELHDTWAVRETGAPRQDPRH